MLPKKSSFVHKFGSLATPCDQTDQLHVLRLQKAKNTILENRKVVFKLFTLSQIHIFINFFKLTRYISNI